MGDFENSSLNRDEEAFASIMASIRKANSCGTERNSFLLSPSAVGSIHGSLDRAASAAGNPR